MRRGDYRRGLGRKDYRRIGQVRTESEDQPVFFQEPASARIVDPGIVRLVVKFTVKGQDEPVRFTFGIRT